MSLVIVGSVAFDTIETPWERKEKIVGGSCTYCALAASFFTRPKIVAVVGRGFPEATIAFFKKRRIDLKGLKIVPGGKTFHWEGRYGYDPNQRETVRTDLNVFEDFRPEIPPSYRKADILFLANIDPDLQETILPQVEKPRLEAMDTIRLWIQTKPEALLRVLKQVDIFFANDEEIRMMTDERNLIKAGRKILEMGPAAGRLKKGEHGALVFGREFVFGILALPCEDGRRPDRGRRQLRRRLPRLSRQGREASAAATSAGPPSTAASWPPSPSRISASTASRRSSRRDVEARFRRFKKLVSF